MFRDQHSLAWMYHKNTCRWLYNLQAPSETASTVAPFKEDCTAPAVRLPAPQLPEMSLEDAIAGRFSCRRFAAAPLRVEDLATLLAAAYGVWGRVVLVEQEFLERPVPSGGGLYPLELYVLAQAGYRPHAGCLPTTRPISHVAEPVKAFSFPERFLAELFLGQPYAAAAAAIIVLTAVVERLALEIRRSGLPVHPPRGRSRSPESEPHGDGPGPRKLQSRRLLRHRSGRTARAR